MSNSNEKTREYKRYYDKTFTKVITMKLNINTDKDILEYLEKLPNKQGKMKELIRNDIKNTK